MPCIYTEAKWPYQKTAIIWNEGGQTTWMAAEINENSLKEAVLYIISFLPILVCDNLYLIKRKGFD